VNPPFTRSHIHLQQGAPAALVNSALLGELITHRAPGPAANIRGANPRRSFVKLVQPRSPFLLLHSRLIVVIPVRGLLALVDLVRGEFYRLLLTKPAHAVPVVGGPQISFTTSSSSRSSFFCQGMSRGSQCILRSARYSLRRGCSICHFLSSNPYLYSSCGLQPSEIYAHPSHLGLTSSMPKKVLQSIVEVHRTTPLSVATDGPEKKKASVKYAEGYRYREHASVLLPGEGQHAASCSNLGCYSANTTRTKPQFWGALSVPAIRTLVLL